MISVLIGEMTLSRLWIHMAENTHIMIQNIWHDIYQKISFMMWLVGNLRWIWYQWLGTCAQLTWWPVPEFCLTEKRALILGCPASAKCQYVHKMEIIFKGISTLSLWTSHLLCLQSVYRTHVYKMSGSEQYRNRSYSLLGDGNSHLASSLAEGLLVTKIGHTSWQDKQCRCMHMPWAYTLETLDTEHPVVSVTVTQEWSWIPV